MNAGDQVQLLNCEDLTSVGRKSPSSNSEIWVQDVRLQTESRIMKYQTSEVELSIKESELMKVFMRSPGYVFSKKELVEKVWAGAELETNAVEGTIMRVRRRIKALQAPIAIKNMRFVGYWLEA